MPPESWALAQYLNGLLQHDPLPPPFCRRPDEGNCPFTGPLIAPAESLQLERTQHHHVSPPGLTCACLSGVRLRGRMLRLDCAVQKYAWGKVGMKSTVAQLKKVRAPPAPFVCLSLICRGQGLFVTDGCAHAFVHVIPGRR